MVMAGAIESVGAEVSGFKSRNKVFGMGGFHFCINGSGNGAWTHSSSAWRKARPMTTDPRRAYVRRSVRARTPEIFDAWTVSSVLRFVDAWGGSDERFGTTIGATHNQIGHKRIECPNAVAELRRD